MWVLCSHPDCLRIHRVGLSRSEKAAHAADSSVSPWLSTRIVLPSNAMTRKLPLPPGGRCIGREVREYLAPLNLARLDINNVQLEYRIRQNQTDDRKIQSGLPDGLQGQSLQELPLCHFATAAIPAQRGGDLASAALAEVGGPRHLRARFMLTLGDILGRGCLSGPFPALG